MADDSNCKLYRKVPSSCWPLVYCSNYNISFFGMERLHPFDAGKWGNIYKHLLEMNLISADKVVKPIEASDDDLEKVHTRRYLNSLKWSANVAMITEILPVAFLPNFIVQRKVLKPFRLQTGGTILAGRLAMERGWAINIGGGFHHCSSDAGGGFCAYADITLNIHYLFEFYEQLERVMIIDLDAHQGNGHARDFLNDNRVYILDIYNCMIYPRDHEAKAGIRRKVEIKSGTKDMAYLELVTTNVNAAIEEFQPQYILYNAGTDILENDPLGCLNITAEGIIKRDEIVFKASREHSIPIAMVTSGGYLRCTAGIVANSILNLHSLGLIQE